MRLDGKRAKAADRVAAGQAVRLPPQVIHDKDERRESRSRQPRVKTCGSLADRILYMDK